MRLARSSDLELLDVIDRYVKPPTQGVGRYLHLLHANFTREDESKRTPFLQSLSAAAHEITDEELEILLESEWRSRLTAAWLIGFDRRDHFRDVLGDLLLASRLCFSGQGYCFALARFGTDEDAQHLAAYLDRYLRRPDCQYDQHWAISALLHIDSRSGSEHAARFLAPGGLWHQWNGAQYSPSPPGRFIDELCAFAAESGHQKPQLGATGRGLSP
ncbi:DUF6000 family protein [Streptomyces sp. NBC_00825]|uniref:DUF6000 family protein n=1 Tax=unclassified Streptomyces TaxID=2593676 RepID=UPI002258804E|nr:MULTISPECIES: DUF6000 family protein [unclassified Streptomyces]WTB51992.1 DUF6000 family protein [Streptomyces sp. NBC_00826]WTH95118.1 DUF6000 family protein [Streptomyces sp. NBC_00825]WTI03852.1 DUF6000 family protein [Streptomyces sp. NBC_00822]MCX4869435.1 DUF6000 family protein [Streptomyces sp. NBC_00906]MCX4900674.1 DUF6000 family protein [Streptomyces sp. NBC_00892]